MFCGVCGKEIANDEQFCPYCGAKVSFDLTNKSENEQDIERIHQKTNMDSIDVDPKQNGSKQVKQDRKNDNNGSKGIVIVVVILLIAAVLVGGFFVAKKVILPNTGIGDVISSDDNDEKHDDSALVDVRLISILSSDWDWDSGKKNSDGTYRVDGILYVENNTDSPIAEIDFSVCDENGKLIKNAGGLDDTFTAYGYVAAGSSGVMVADVNTYKEKIRPVDNSYTIESAYRISSDLDGYLVPNGYLTDNYGPNNDYYDIELDNLNDVEVSRNSIIVTIRMVGNKIKDSDATGMISSSIPPKTVGYAQEIAFYDPNLSSRDLMDEYMVYALDVDLYKTYMIKDE